MKPQAEQSEKTDAEVAPAVAMPKKTLLNFYQ